jgi:hypothetical protein
MAKIRPIQRADLYLTGALLEKNGTNSGTTVTVPARAESNRFVHRFLPESPLVINRIKKMAKVRSWGATTAILSHVRANDHFDPIKLCGALTSDKNHGQHSFRTQLILFYRP